MRSGTKDSRGPHYRRAQEQTASRPNLRIRDQWIIEEPNGTFARAWYEQGSGRTRRRSLGTRDLEEAKAELIRIVLSEPAERAGSPQSVHLASVFKFYELNHGPNIRGLKQARRPAALCLEFMQKATASPLPVVADFTLLRQHAFMQWLRDRELSVKTISTYQAMIKAAMNFAATPRLIVDSKGAEREGQLLDHQWKIFDSEDYVSKVTGLPMPQPVKFLPTDDELARFIDAISREHVFRYVILALNTWARPEAIMELDVAKQVDFEKGLIDLNPPGRRQNRKVRPTIRLDRKLEGLVPSLEPGEAHRPQGRNCEGD